MKTKQVIRYPQINFVLDEQFKNMLQQNICCNSRRIKYNFRKLTLIYKIFSYNKYWHNCFSWKKELQIWNVQKKKREKGEMRKIEREKTSQSLLNYKQPTKTTRLKVQMDRAKTRSLHLRIPWSDKNVNHMNSRFISIRVTLCPSLRTPPSKLPSYWQTDSTCNIIWKIDDQLNGWRKNSPSQRVAF